MITNRAEIRKLVLEEANRGTELYGVNHSRHEGFAVTKEEFDEFEAEYDKLVCKMDEIWKLVKGDVPTEIFKDAVLNAESTAVEMIAEAIQLAAMLQKMVNFEDGVTEDGEH